MDAGGLRDSSITQTGLICPQRLLQANPDGRDGWLPCSFIKWQVFEFQSNKVCPSSALTSGTSCLCGSDLPHTAAPLWLPPHMNSYLFAQWTWEAQYCNFCYLQPLWQRGCFLSSCSRNETVSLKWRGCITHCWCCRPWAEKDAFLHAFKIICKQMYVKFWY